LRTEAPASSSALVGERLLSIPARGQIIRFTADLDPGEIAEGQFGPDVVGHYASPEVFRLEVNETWRKWLRNEVKTPTNEYRRAEKALIQAVSIVTKQA
jgi:hypothetical protein